MNPDSPSIFVRGVGAVSPAGWGLDSLRKALADGTPIPFTELPRPGAQPLKVRRVPPPNPRPAFLSHPRLRRTSPIAHYTVSAALEALGPDASVPARLSRLGVVFCAMSGSVNYSRRFYDETLKDPATASPVVFPETVYNSPASHLAALIGTNAVNYTLVGDPGTFLKGIALAADWLARGIADGCVVVGAEEIDWLTAEALTLFDRHAIPGEGAGALYLQRDRSTDAQARLLAITHPHVFADGSGRPRAAARARAESPGPVPGELLCDGLQGISRADDPERSAWLDWRGPRLSPKIVLGEGLVAAAAWQCVAAVDALHKNGYPAATVSVVGCNEQAIAARFGNIRAGS